MNENCFDIGTIQAFLDGELASERLEAVACHIADCEACSFQLAAAEDETAFAFNVLEQEFNTLVPTQRLWTKINDSIERERKSFWAQVFAFFRNPALATFAAFLVVFAVFVAYLNNGNENQPIASVSNPQSQTVSQASPVERTTVSSTTSEPFGGVTPVKTDDGVETVAPSPVKTRQSYKVVNAGGFSSTKTRHERPVPQVVTDIQKPPVYEYLPGEESYIKTIATLQKNIDARKDEVMKPSTRMSFEKNLALVDVAIRNMKEQVKKDPKNEAAKQVLLSSYQNKVDLLTSVAEKTELMAVR